jgi:hypothetical protein
VLVDGEWMGKWTAQVEPGNWILRATYESQNLVAMGLVQAEVATGASVDFEMSVGGWITLETEWLDFEGVTRTLADTDIEGADMVDESELILNIGMGMRWVAQVDEAGVLEMLLIAGVIDTSSEFEVVQRNLTMTYTGGQGLTVSPGQEAPLAVLSHSSNNFFLSTVFFTDRSVTYSSWRSSLISWNSLKERSSIFET